jgi:N-acetylgalactosamine kinase
MPAKNHQQQTRNRASVQSSVKPAGVILCGGKGTRMGRTHLHKVCFPVAGRPSIVRLIDTLRGEGVDPLIVVVGHKAGDVIETIGSSHPGVHFVFQRDRLGTGHAARIGIQALTQFGFRGSVLITMGDKWIAPELLRNATGRFARSAADLLVVSEPKREDSSAGRLVHDGRSNILGNVELRDIQRARVLHAWLELAEKKTAISKAQLRREGLAFIKPAAKLWKALGGLAHFCRGSGTVPATELIQEIKEVGTSIVLGGKSFNPDTIESRSPTLNASLYLGNLEVVEAALNRVGRLNAQDEYYLTDIIELIANGVAYERPKPGKRVIEHTLPDPHDVMAFNTKTELRRIEEHVESLEKQTSIEALNRKLTRFLRKPDEWLKLFGPNAAKGRKLIEQTYGAHGSFVTERMRAVRQVVRLFAQHHGRNRKLFLVRAPGRVNLMGRHIDHQGGYAHAVAIDTEVLMAVAPRKDDVISLVNSDPVAFPKREVVIGDWLGPLRTNDNWLSFVNSEGVRVHLMSTAGDWSNYALASALHQQFHHPDQRLFGFDAAVVGNIPMASGLSSSSAMVVAAMEAINAVNNVKVNDSQVVSDCGQAEWFVGSRGGAADHAAIRLGRAGHAARMGFHPFRISRYVPIPDDARILIAASGEHAVKSAGARDRFNERVACYRLGILLLKKRHPDLADQLDYVRDLAPSQLKVGDEEVKALLSELPNRITRAELRKKLGGRYAEELERLFTAHSDPGTYTIRDVVTYGVGECERARIAAGRLEQESLESFGELMRLSHDGDRISNRFSSNGSVSPNGNGPLYQLVGAYACSTKRIDQLVKLTQSINGVYGTQLAGAGLGGCVTILADNAGAARVKKTLTKEFYEPLGLKPAIWQVRSVSGGGVIKP